MPKQSLVFAWLAKTLDPIQAWVALALELNLTLLYYHPLFDIVKAKSSHVSDMFPKSSQ